jgi:hypothetical protein
MDNQARQLISLAASLQPLQEYFNSNQGKPRFMALVSPTCPECLAEANAVQHSILRAFPGAELSASLVWVPMLDDDDEEAARLVAATISDARVLHFYDGANRAGKAIARLFGEKNRLAWDIYLFFSHTAIWQNLPPRSQEWFHQLEKKADSWAGPGQYRCGKTLAEALYQATGELYLFKPAD